MNDNVCFDLYTAYPLADVLPGINPNVGVGALVLGLVYFFSAVVTIFWIKQQQYNALQGMTGAAMHVIFPIYLPFMWLSALSDSLIGIMLLFITVHYRGTNTWTSSIFAAAAFSFQHFVIEGIAFILMQYGCGLQAVKSAAIWASGWGLATFFVEFVLFRDGDTNASFIGSMFWNIILLVFYSILWLTPETKLFRRVAVIHYARFWAIVRLIVIIAEVLYEFGDANSLETTTSNCLFAIITVPLILICKPFLIYQALLLDSKWWQGLNLRNNRQSNMFSSHLPSFQRMYQSEKGGSFLAASFVKLFAGGVDVAGNDSETGSGPMSDNSGSPANGGFFSSLYGRMTNTAPSSGPLGRGGYGYEAIKGPLMGVEVGFSEAQELAREVDNIHQQGTIRLLNFAYLSLDSKAKLLGAGSFSKVYSGYYKGTPVAIKMLFTQDLNPDVIKRCSNEARILSELSHSEHVVKIYGAAVLPPSVCIVLEICEYGSLSDILRGSNGGGIVRQPLKLTMADRMFLAYGCAKGLEALHSYSPDLCHRDIKSFNYLIDSQLNAKIADLDLGEHTDCVRGPSDGRNSGLRDSYGYNNSYNASFSTNMRRMKEASRSDMNITWQAPEVLLGQGYTQRSDVHSLAMVLWEIIASGRTTKKFNQSSSMASISSTNVSFLSVPYADCKNQQAIREKIVRGIRPPINSFVDLNNKNDVSLGGADRKYVIDPLYIALMTKAWCPDPIGRPTAADMVIVLRKCWLNCLHRHITETEFVIDIEKIQKENFRLALQEDSSPRNPMISGVSGSQRSSMKKSTSSKMFSPFSSSPTPTTSMKRNSSIIRHVPSAEVMETLSLMKAEAKWSKLEDESSNTPTGSYLVVTATRPFYMLWATKRWTQLMGYLVNDIIAYELSVLFGPHMQTIMKVENMLDSIVNSNGNVGPLHIVLPLPRRDGKEAMISLHMFPVYESFGHGGPSSVSSTPSTASTASYVQSPHNAVRPSRLSFSATGTGPMYGGNSIQNPIPSKSNTGAGANTTIKRSGSSTSLIQDASVPPSIATPANEGVRFSESATDSPEGESQSLLVAPQSTQSAGPSGTFMRDVGSVPNTPALIKDDSSVLSYGDVYCNTVSSTQSNPVSNFSMISPMRSTIKPVNNGSLLGDDNVASNTLANGSTVNNYPVASTTTVQPQTDMSISMYSDSTTDEVMYHEPDSHISILNSVLSANGNPASDANSILGTPAGRLQQSSYYSSSSHSMFSTQAAMGTVQRIQAPITEMRKVAYIVLHFSTPKE